MKWIKYLILTIVLLTAAPKESNAQIDTLFWFAAPWVTPDHNGNTPLAFRISTFSAPAVVRIQLPAGTFDTTIFVPANGLASADLSYIVNDIESSPADAILNSGVKITSDELITVIYDFISLSPNNPETYSLKGQNGMGTEFVVPCQTKWNNQTLGGASPLQPKQFFSIVATEDNTTVYIKPNAYVVGHPADATYAVILPLAGNVYTCENVVQNTNVPGNNLSGSIVTSDKAVSITMNDDSVNPSGGGGCYDLMGDQIVPTDVIGKEYIVNIGGLNGGSDESLFVIPAENFTTITVTDLGGTTTQLMNQGETWGYSVTDPLTHIIADKPIYLIHMSGYGCELGLAILPPLNCAGSDEVSFSRNNGQAYSLNLLCELGDEVGFTLTTPGTGTINPAAFNPVPGAPGWVGAQITYNTTEIPNNVQNTITNSMGFFSMGVINGGATSGCLYHYLSSFQRKVFVDAGPDTTLCTGSGTINLDGSVQGGTTTGLWTILDGTSTIASPSSLSTTYDPTASDYAQGYLTFVLESVGNCDPKYDTLLVTFIESPQVNAGLDDIYCKNNVPAIPLSGSLAYAVGSEWSGGVGGAFDDISDLTTNYLPSPTDLAEDSLLIFIESSGSFFSCPDDKDTVVIYFTPAPNVVAGPDIVVCSSDTLASVNGTVSGPTSTGIWTTSGSGTFDPSELLLSTDYLMSSADTAAGSVTLVLTSTANGACLAESDSLVVTILDKPNVLITSADSVCANAITFDMTGEVTTGYPHEWTFDGSGFVTSPTSLSTTYNISPLDTVSGFIDIYLSTTGGLCPIEYDSLRVHFVTPPYAYAGPDVSFCENESAGLVGALGGSAFSGQWSSLGTGSFDPSADLLSTFYNPSALDISNGSVQLILTSSANYGCLPDKDTLLLTYLEAPEADFSYVSACVGKNTIFTDGTTISSGTIITWDYDFGDGDSSIAQHPNHPYAGSGAYFVTLIAEADNGCIDTVVQSVYVNPVPTADFTNGYGCIDEELNFYDNSFISPGNVVDWVWDFNAGEGSATVKNPDYTFTQAGLFPVFLQVTSDSGCVDTITKYASISGGPTADFEFTPSPAIALEDVFFTDVSTNGPITNWIWDFGDGIGGSAPTEIHVYQNGGSFEVLLQVADTAGCIDTVRKTIEVVLLPVLPTAFTPNGDGENDVFLIRGGPFDAVDFKIFNNWGQLVFSTTELDVGWDGTYQGVEAQLGVYTWTFTVEVAGDRIITREGDVTLIR